jgi:hypothetical protein
LDVVALRLLIGGDFLDRCRRLLWRDRAGLWLGIHGLREGFVDRPARQNFNVSRLCRGFLGTHPMAGGQQCHQAERGNHEGRTTAVHNGIPCVEVLIMYHYFFALLYCRQIITGHSLPQDSAHGVQDEDLLSRRLAGVSLAQVQRVEVPLHCQVADAPWLLNPYEE